MGETRTAAQQSGYGADSACAYCTVQQSPKYLVPGFVRCHHVSEYQVRSTSQQYSSNLRVCVFCVTAGHGMHQYTSCRDTTIPRYPGTVCKYEVHIYHTTGIRGLPCYIMCSYVLRTNLWTSASLVLTSIYTLVPCTRRSSDLLRVYEYLIVRII